MTSRARALLFLTAALMIAPLPAGAAGGLESTPEAADAPDHDHGAQAVHHVHMQVAGFVFQFDPPVVNAAPGDVIEFHSHDIPHSATSGLDNFLEPVEGLAPSDAHLNSFDTGVLGGGSSVSVTVTDSGNYPYYCKVGLHRLFGMHGNIVVS